VFYKEIKEIAIVFTINILHRIQETKWINMVVKLKQ
jgi:hypothetical protein